MIYKGGYAMKDDLQRIIENGCKHDFRDERELREKVVSELLKSLGWDPFTEVSRENLLRRSSRRLG